MGGIDGDVPKVPSKCIVVKRIKMTRKRVATRTRNIAVAKKPMKSSTARRRNKSCGLPKPTRKAPTSSFGLPSFRFEAKPSESEWRNSDRMNGDVSRAHLEVDNDSSSFYPHNEGPEEEIPSDTLMAIYSLIQSNQGLHIPITNNGSVQVILENQIYSIFHENHASTVNAELSELIHTNKLHRMYCHDISTTAYMQTEDYVIAVWDSHSHENHPSSDTVEKQGSSEDILSWFLAQLHHWTKLSISESSLEDRWETNNNNNTEDTGFDAKDVVRYLLNAQFLIRDPQQNLSSGGNKEQDSYFLWLPNWGIVLKTWNQARQQLLVFLAQRKEMSKANLLQKNRHSHISTNFLLNELLSKERIRVVERPFGSFVQLVKDS